MEMATKSNTTMVVTGFMIGFLSIEKL